MNQSIGPSALAALLISACASSSEPAKTGEAEAPPATDTYEVTVVSLVDHGRLSPADEPFSMTVKLTPEGTYEASESDGQTRTGPFTREPGWIKFGGEQPANFAVDDETRPTRFCLDPATTKTDAPKTAGSYDFVIAENAEALAASFEGERMTIQMGGETVYDGAFSLKDDLLQLDDDRAFGWFHRNGELVLCRSYLSKR